MPRVRNYEKNNERSSNSDASLYKTDKRVPPGSFVVLSGLPAGMTDDECSEWIYNSINLSIPAENIAMRNYPHISTALVSVPRAEIVRLFNWLLMNNAEIKNVVARQFGPNTL